MLLDIPLFLGRLHPLVVHLPIGFLLLALLFDLLSYHNRYAYLKNAVPFTLLAGFVTAVAACIFGWLLSLSGDYNPETLDDHRWAGILLCIIAGAFYWASLKSAAKYLVVPRRLFSVLFVGLAALMAYTGHQGASLTHGSSYLSVEVLTKHNRPRPQRAGDALLYEDVVAPLLETRCGQCHRAGKLKGKLSVASITSLLKGGKHGAALVPGKPAESELFKRITLDPDNEAYMPAEGKTALTKNEVEIIRWWIEKGITDSGKSIAALKDTSIISPRVAVYLGLSKTLPGDINAPLAQHINPAIPAHADTAAIQRLVSKGWMIRPLLQQPLMLDVVLPAGSGIAMATVKADLEKLAKNIVWLNLSGNNLTDGDLVFLHLLTNLEKLRLENNPVSDKISTQLSSLNHLEAVNLNGTHITGQSLVVLSGNTAIKRLYTWKTGVQ